jgi:Cd2+/Zn2+-exporting ATPase
MRAVGDASRHERLRRMSDHARRGRLNINALMSVAVAGAFVIGQWPEAAMVMALYAIAELIEARSVDRARNAIKGLLALSPDTADLRQPTAPGKQCPAGEVPIDATVRVRPGARIPLDGVVHAGNEQREPGAGHRREHAGGQGARRHGVRRHDQRNRHARVAGHRRRRRNTTLARIIHAVEQAQGTQGADPAFVDRFAAIYTPAVFAIAVPWPC